MDPGGVHTRLPGQPSGLGHVCVHFLLRDDHALLLPLHFRPQPEEDLEFLGRILSRLLKARISERLFKMGLCLPAEAEKVGLR